MDAVVAPKASVNPRENEKKVWAEPIKTSLPVAKVTNESKKEEMKQMLTLRVNSKM